MPKFAVHHIALDEATTKLKASSAASARQAASALEAEPAAATIGTTGPDMFYAGPDSSPMIYMVLSNIEQVRQEVDEFLKPVSDVMDAIKAAIRGQAEEYFPLTTELFDLVMSRVGWLKEALPQFRLMLGANIFIGLSDALDSTVSASNEAAVNLGRLLGANPNPNIIEQPEVATSITNWIFNLYLPAREGGRSFESWPWGDVLHYRRTGEFARQLLSLARTPRQKAYAFGYLSHIGTDVTGHAFVNQVCGAPYRLGVQRHATVEMFQDAVAYRQHTGQEINRTLTSHLGLPETLPDDIASLLRSALQATYPTGEGIPWRVNGRLESYLAPEKYTPAQLDMTYVLFRNSIDSLVSTSLPRPEEPFSGVLDLLLEALNLIGGIEAPPAPPAISGACSWEDTFSFGLTGRSRECYTNFYRNSVQVVQYFADLAKWTFETLTSVLDRILALQGTLYALPILTLLYFIELLIWELYCRLRSTLVELGFLYPDPIDLGTSLERSLTSGLTCVPSMPYSGSTHHESLETGFPRINARGVGHLVCPEGPVEKPANLPWPLPPAAQMSWFIREAPFDPEAVALYAAARTPEATRNLTRNGRCLGNAVDLTAWMVENATNAAAHCAVFANWDLDSDRGYAYLQWLWDQQPPIEAYGQDGDVQTAGLGHWGEVARHIVNRVPRRTRVGQPPVFKV